VTVLRDGALVNTVAVADTTEDRLISMMVGRELTASTRAPTSTIGAEALRVSELHTDNGLRGVSLSVAHGEVLGVYGLLGSGRSELARAVFGVDHVVSGEIWIDGEHVTPKSPRDAIQLGIGLVAEDRETQGLFPGLSIRRNLTSASADLTSRLGWISSAAEKRLSLATMNDLSIRASGIEQSVSELSGGNQQKVTAGRWTMRKCKVMILDDPTAGVDVGSKEDFYRLISAMTDAGTAVLLMSSDLPEILRLTDRIVVLHAGHQVGTVSGHDRTEDAVVRMALGN
jgi:ribose transport system ATP-binding protein